MMPTQDPQQRFLDRMADHYLPRPVDTAARIFETVCLVGGFAIVTAYLAPQIGASPDAASLAGSMIGLAALKKLRHHDNRSR